MFRGRFQDRPYVAALRVGRTKAIGPVGESDIPIDPKVDDDFGFASESVDMARLMVLRVGNEPDFVEPQRCHASHYNLSGLGYQQ